MRATLKNILLGICLGSALFVVTGVVFDVINSGNFQLSNWAYTKMAIGAIVVGMGFSVPSKIYDNDKLSLGIQTLIHMGIGCTVFVIVAFAVGWIPTAAGWLTCVLVILGQLLISFLIWMVFAFYYRKMAKRMNEKIDRMQKQTGRE